MIATDVAILAVVLLAPVYLGVAAALAVAMNRRSARGRH